MFKKQPKPRAFDYQPRFYKPEEDPEVKRKERLGFRSNLRPRSQKRSPLVFIVLLVVVIYIMLKYQGLV